MNYESFSSTLISLSWGTHIQIIYLGDLMFDCLTIEIGVWQIMSCFVLWLRVVILIGPQSCGMAFLVNHDKL